MKFRQAVAKTLRDFQSWRPRPSLADKQVAFILLPLIVGGALIGLAVNQALGPFFAAFPILEAFVAAWVVGWLFFAFSVLQKWKE